MIRNERDQTELTTIKRIIKKKHLKPKLRENLHFYLKDILVKKKKNQTKFAENMVVVISEKSFQMVS